MKRSEGLLCFLACALLGCANDLAEYNRLDRLRVLGVRYGAAGAQTEEDITNFTLRLSTLRILVSDPTGAERALNWSVSGCVDPGINLGAEATCGDAVTNVPNGATGTIGASTLNAANGFTTTIDPGLADIPIGDLTSSIPSYSQIPAFQRQNGLTYLLDWTLEGSSTERIRFIKKIVVSEKPIRNSNPSLTDILVDGASISAYPSENQSLSAQIAVGSDETFDRFLSDGSTESSTETLTTTWFITQGSLGFFRTIGAGENRFKNRKDETETLQVICAVTRDGRGGADWNCQNF